MEGKGETFWMLGNNRKVTLEQFPTVSVDNDLTKQWLNAVEGE